MALVLARRVQESIVIQKGDEVIVTLKICHIDRNQVRIGFEADKDVIIMRSELLENTGELRGVK